MCAGLAAAARIDHSEKHRSPTRNSRNRAHFAARTRRNFLSFEGFWLLLFRASYALMQVGLLSFMRGRLGHCASILRRVGPFEVRRRVEQEAGNSLIGYRSHRKNVTASAGLGTAWRVIAGRKTTSWR